MPFKNQQAFRLIDPSKFEQESFRRKNIEKGIDIILGKLKGENTMTAQSYRFNSEIFTFEEAKKWMEEHNIKFIEAEKSENDNFDVDDMLIKQSFFDVFDESRLLTDKCKLTKDGFLKGRAIVTNTGIFNYMTQDAKLLRELRPPEEVFKQESLDTLKNIPTTKGHPKETVTSDNIEELQKQGIIIGFTGSNVQHDGHAVSVDYTITNKEAIKGIQDKIEKALSCGYNADLDFSKRGYAFGNNEYDAVQRNIIYNHVAVVEKGRAGDLAEIRTDEQINFSVQIIDKQKKEDKMNEVKFILDNVEYNIDKDLVKHINQLSLDKSNLSKKLEDVEKEKEEMKKELSKTKGEKDAFEKEAKDLAEKAKLVKSDEDILKAVNARIELQKLADNLKVAYDEKTSNKDIKLAIIKAKNDKLDLTDKDEVYIDACFDTIKSFVNNEIANENKKDIFAGVNNKPKVKTKQEMHDELIAKIKAESLNYKGSASI
jgi:hypothetical protein